MVAVTTSARRALSLAAAVLAIAACAAPARALEPRELAGWWIAIDDTFPKLWQQRATAPVEEVLQINPDGRITDRAMNFWAGSHQACLEKNVCSDLPQIAVARMRLTGNRLTFFNVVVSNARLDSPEGDALIRREAVTTSASWTLTADGNRLTLRSSNPTRLRVLARIEPDRLRKIYAGLRASGRAADDHWRCFLANATANDGAFAPLQAGRSYAPPDFLDRYLNLASYIEAIRAAIATPAIDETNPERRKLLAVEPDEQMVLHFGSILRPPAVNERRRLNAVLTYIDRHSRTMIASNAAAAIAADAKTHADAASREAARTAANAKAATATAAAALIAAQETAAAHQQAQARAVSQTQTAKDTAALARDAESHAASAQSASNTATASSEAATRAAAAQKQKSDTATRIATEQRQRYDTASRQAAELSQALKSAKSAAAPQLRKAAAAALAAAEQQRKYNTARLLADELQERSDDAKRAAAAQEQRSRNAAAAAQSYAEVVAAAQKMADESAAWLGSDSAPNSSAATPAEEPSRASAPDIALTAAMSAAMAARDRLKAEADDAAADAADLARAAHSAQRRAAVASDAALAAQTARDQSKTTAEAATREANRLAAIARDTERKHVAAIDAANAARSARDKSRIEAEADAAEAAKLAALAETAAQRASQALNAARTATAARDKALSDADTAAREALQRTDAARHAAAAASAASEAATVASARERETKSVADQAAQVSAKATAELRLAANNANAAAEAMKEAAATQPQGEGLIPITTADIAAFAHVVDNESDVARKLFCGGREASAPPDKDETAAVTMTTPVAPLVDTPRVDPPVSAPAPTTAAVVTQTSGNAVLPPAVTAPTPAPTPTPVLTTVTVPLPVARPSRLRR